MNLYKTQKWIQLFKDTSQKFSKFSLHKCWKWRKIPSLKSQSIEGQMVSLSIVFTFCLLESWSRDQSEWTNAFHNKTKFLATVLRYYRYIVLRRCHVFFVHFLLIYIKHDIVFTYSKITNLTNLTNQNKIWYNNV